MKRNESNIDRIIRGILGAVLLLVAFLAVPTGTLQIVLVVIGAILLVTGAVGFARSTQSWACRPRNDGVTDHHPRARGCPKRIGQLLRSFWKRDSTGA